MPGDIRTGFIPNTSRKHYRLSHSAHTPQRTERQLPGRTINILSQDVDKLNKNQHGITVAGYRSACVGRGFKLACPCRCYATGRTDVSVGLPQNHI
jgi:hypothetical protein